MTIRQPPPVISADWLTKRADLARVDANLSAGMLALRSRGDQRRCRVRFQPAGGIRITAAVKPWPLVRSRLPPASQRQSAPRDAAGRPCASGTNPPLLVLRGRPRV